MFEFLGNAAAPKDGTGAEWRLVDHRNIQDLGKRPFTTMVLPTTPQPSKPEGANRPSPPLRSRSNSIVPTYSRPQGSDDLAPVATSIYRPTPRLHVDRRSLSRRSTHPKGDGLDTFNPKVWMAKGSKLLKRENSKHELTSLRPLDWVEESQEARAPHVRGLPAPPELGTSRMRPSGDSTAATQLHISEPFNFHHITHTQRHHVQNLDIVNTEELVSGFSALRASQVSQPELRGINAKDIPREDSPRDALLPHCPSPNHHAALPPFPTSKNPYSAPDGPDGAMSPECAWELEYSRKLADNYSHPTAAYHTAQTSPISPSSRTSFHNTTPDFFTFHDELLSDTISEQLIPTEPPEPLDYSIGPWDDRNYDLASPHAVTTDDCAGFIRQGPFTMVKTELAPVEEDDEDEEEEEEEEEGEEDSVLPDGHRMKLGPRKEKSSPGAKVPYSDLVHEHCTQANRVSGPSIEDPIDDIPIRSRFSRCISVGPSDMEGFWDMASDAISCSYALGAEGDSNFDWHRWSIHEGDTTAPTAEENQTDAVDMNSDFPKTKPQDHPPSPNRIAVKRSSSVYSTSSLQIMPLQTSLSKPEPPSASSTASSFSNSPGAITPIEMTESGMVIRFGAMNDKEWCQPAYIVPNDLEPQAVQEALYQRMYVGEYSEEAAPFQIRNVGRVDGSTISNSPRSSRSPISKSSSQESFRGSQSTINTRRLRNAGSIGSLPELIHSKNSRERFDFTVDKYTENTVSSDPSESPSDSQQTSPAQRRRSPNLAKDAAQNIILSKVRIPERPVPPLPASGDRSISDVTSPTQDSSMALPAQAEPGKRMRAWSSASNLSAISSSSGGSFSSLMPAPLAPSRRNS